MELYQIRYFLALVEQGSFVKAAETSYVSQPTLSAGIKKLEDDLGVRLFERSGRETTLTSAGTRFLDHARIIAAEMTAARVSAAGGEAETDLRLGVVRTLPTDHIGRTLASFAGTNSGAFVRLRDGTGRELAHWLQRRRINAAIRTRDRHDDGLDGSFEHQTLFRSRLMLAVHEDHPLARRNRVDLEQLDDLPMIGRGHCELMPEIRRILKEHQVRPRVIYRTDRDDYAVAAARAGLGAVVIPDRLRDRGLRLLPVRGLDMVQEVVLTWRTEDPNPALPLLREHLGRIDWRARPRARPAAERLPWAH
jgi:DNA-binding transcriptional LysR family regulator